MKIPITILALFLLPACLDIEGREARIKAEILNCSGNPYYDVVQRSDDPPGAYLARLKEGEKSAAGSCQSGVMRNENRVYVEDYCNSQGVCTIRTRHCYSCVSSDDPMLK